MGIFGKPGSPDPAAPSGMEMMVRSLGFGPLLDMGLQLANDGTLAKIVAFAESADEILNTLRRVENELKRANDIRDRQSYIPPGVSQPHASSYNGPGRSAPCVGDVAGQLVDGLSDSSGTVRHGDAGRHSGDEPACSATDDCVAGDARTDQGT